jgi:probable F420-dependent oxidoreductase
MLSGVGIWSTAMRYGEPDERFDAAAEIESLGYSAIWIPDAGGDVFGALDLLLAATTTITVATGVLNIWRQTPEATNEWWAGLSETDRSRVVLGLGVSHGPRIGEAWGAPIATMATFLDGLEVPVESRCIGALGPRMLDLARDRTSGAAPYLVTPEHTAAARERLGQDALLAPEQGVVLGADLDVARAIARAELANYAELPNYSRNWRRMGFSDHEVMTLSDRLVDALIVCGDQEAVAARVAQHRDAGADHICLQVLPGRAGMQGAAWRALALLTTP